MAGGVHPAEWILPPAALSHLIYNTAAESAGAEDYRAVAPGSELDQERRLGDAREQQEKDVAEQEKVRAAQYLAENPPPQTSRDEELSRKRAFSAGSNRYGGKRASQYLSGGERALGAA